MKPMTQGQKDLHEISMDAQATESHLNGIRVIIVLLRRKVLHLADALLIGVIIGMLWAWRLVGW